MMSRLSLVCLVCLAINGASVRAGGLFGTPLGYYGPYTGGHPYSYNVAYGYGFHFSAADTWKRDLLAYPTGITPYRPNGRPIYHRVFPKPDVPYIAVPGPDDLPMLVKPSMPMIGEGDHPVVSKPVSGPVAVPHLQPIPQAIDQSATIRLVVPENAEVWVEKQKLQQTGAERAFQTPPLAAGQTRIYSVRARWLDTAGQAVEQFRVVGVKAGETARLTFVGQ